MITSILFVPADEWRERVIGDGPCGSRPPIMPYGGDGGEAWGRALVLAWNGKPVPDGIFRGWLAWGPDEDPEFEATGWSTYDVLAEAMDTLKSAEWLARALERCGVGVAMVLDESGAEVMTPEQRRAVLVEEGLTEAVDAGPETVFADVAERIAVRCRILRDERDALRAEIAALRALPKKWRDARTLPTLNLAHADIWQNARAFCADEIDTVPRAGGES